MPLKRQPLAELPLQEWHSLLISDDATRVFLSDEHRSRDAISQLVGASGSRGAVSGGGLLLLSRPATRLRVLAWVQRHAALLCARAPQPQLRALYDALHEAAWRTPYQGRGGSEGHGGIELFDAENAAAFPSLPSPHSPSAAPSELAASQLPEASLKALSALCCKVDLPQRDPRLLRLQVESLLRALGADLEAGQAPGEVPAARRAALAAGLLQRLEGAYPGLLWGRLGAVGRLLAAGLRAEASARRAAWGWGRQAEAGPLPKALEALVALIVAVGGGAAEAFGKSDKGGCRGLEIGEYGEDGGFCEDGSFDGEERILEDGVCAAGSGMASASVVVASSLAKIRFQLPPHLSSSGRASPSSSRRPPPAASLAPADRGALGKLALLLLSLLPRLADREAGRLARALPALLRAGAVPAREACPSLARWLAPTSKEAASTRAFEAALELLCTLPENELEPLWPRLLGPVLEVIRGDAGEDRVAMERRVVAVRWLLRRHAWETTRGDRRRWGFEALEEAWPALLPGPTDPPPLMLLRLRACVALAARGLAGEEEGSSGQSRDGAQKTSGPAVLLSGRTPLPAEERLHVTLCALLGWRGFAEPGAEAGRAAACALRTLGPLAEGPWAPARALVAAATAQLLLEHSAALEPALGVGWVARGFGEGRGRDEIGDKAPTDEAVSERGLSDGARCPETAPSPGASPAPASPLLPNPPPQITLRPRRPPEAAPAGEMLAAAMEGALLQAALHLEESSARASSATPQQSVRLPRQASYPALSTPFSTVPRSVSAGNLGAQETPCPSPSTPTPARTWPSKLRSLCALRLNSPCSPLYGREEDDEGRSNGPVPPLASPLRSEASTPRATSCASALLPSPQPSSMLSTRSVPASPASVSARVWHALPFACRADPAPAALALPDLASAVAGPTAWLAHPETWGPVAARLAAAVESRGAALASLAAAAARLRDASSALRLARAALALSGSGLHRRRLEARLLALCHARLLWFGRRRVRPAEAERRALLQLLDGLRGAAGLLGRRAAELEAVVETLCADPEAAAPRVVENVAAWCVRSQLKMQTEPWEA